MLKSALIVAIIVPLGISMNKLKLLAANCIAKTQYNVTIEVTGSLQCRCTYRKPGFSEGT